MQPYKLATGLVAAHLVNHDSRTTAAPRRRRRASAAAGVAVSALATMWVLAAPGASADAKTPAATRAAGPALQAILDRAVRAPETTFPGVALYVRGPGRMSWSGAAGNSAIGPDRAMRPNDRFRAGSIIKPLVAAATLQLVEEGRFALDDPLPAVLLSQGVIERFVEADRYHRAHAAQPHERDRRVQRRGLQGRGARRPAAPVER